MLRHLVQTVGRGFILDRFDRAVIIVGVCNRRVRETLVLNVHYLDWRICHFTKLLMFWEMYVNLAEVFDGDVKRVARLNVRNGFSGHACSALPHVLMGNYLY